MLAAVFICPTVTATTQEAQAKKYIAFRNDDIRPGMSLDGLKAVNQVHIDENVPVTLGIIPHPNESGQANQLLQDGLFHLICSLSPLILCLSSHSTVIPIRAIRYQKSLASSSGCLTTISTTAY